MSNLSMSTEDYLEAIYMIELENKSPKVHSVAIAKHLGVTKAAVSRAMNHLASSELIEKELYGNISLTDKGREIAIAVYDKHLTLKTFLMNIGISEEVASIDCCKIEHIISEETYTKIKEFNSEFGELKRG